MRGHTLFRVFSIAAFLACYVTIMVGGNVIASGAGLGCSEWPACQGSQVIPPLTGAAAIEFSHRASAFILSVLVLALTVSALLFEAARPQLRRLCLAALVTVVLEAILGGVVVDSDLVVTIVLAHFAIATVLFALLILIALLANIRELPPRWKAWARSAIDGERSPRPSEPRAPSPEGRPVPGRAPAARARDLAAGIPGPGPGAGRS